MAVPTPIRNRSAPARDSHHKPLSPDEIIEQVLIHGDLRELTPDQRTDYYKRMCDSIGVNPLTRPFAYITLNGRLVLYALRDCTDQLRKLHAVSVVETRQEEINDVYIVVCKVKDRDERTDEARGAVHIGGLQKEALANAIMKAETKAKRRATLSICGLGFLDETEIEDISPKRRSSSSAKKDGTAEVFNEIKNHIVAAPDLEFLSSLLKHYAKELETLPTRWILLISQEFEDKWNDLGGDASECPLQASE